MNKKSFKNGGFPPLKYCPAVIESKSDKLETKQTSKERLFANAPKQNISIRQLLSDSKKKPIIITDEVDQEVIEEVTSL